MKTCSQDNKTVGDIVLYYRYQLGRYINKIDDANINKIDDAIL